MSRFSRYDTDEERLPQGMSRVGYDAESQTYTYRDADGSYWEGAPGAEYGHLTRVSGGSCPNSDNDDNSDDRAPFIPGSGEPPRLEPWELEQQSWRQAWAPLLNFFVLVGLFLIGVIWLLYHFKRTPPERIECGGLGEAAYRIHKGDTCWAIANRKGTSVEDLLGSNSSLDCDRLKVGSWICVPAGNGNVASKL